MELTTQADYCLKLISDTDVISPMQKYLPQNLLNKIPTRAENFPKLINDTDGKWSDTAKFFLEINKRTGTFIRYSRVPCHSYYPLEIINAQVAHHTHNYNP